MVESNKEKPEKSDIQEKIKEGKKVAVAAEDKKPRAETLIRILSTDIPGDFTVYHGLTRIKGISWAFANAICSDEYSKKQKDV